MKKVKLWRLASALFIATLMLLSPGLMSLAEDVDMFQTEETTETTQQTTTQQTTETMAGQTASAETSLFSQQMLRQSGPIVLALPPGTPGESTANPVTTWAELQAAITAASPGDDIYIGSVTIPMGSTITLDKNLGFVGTGTNTILTGPAGRHFVTSGTVSVAFQNLSLQGGGSGGGLEVAAGGTMTITGCTVEDNQTTGDGGGVLVHTNGTLIMESGNIKNNTTGINGGGVFVDASGTFLMNGGQISGNVTTAANGYGGGVYVSGSGNFTMSGGTIGGDASAKNMAYSGGGIFVEQAASNAVNITGGTISDNEATQDGGGLYLDGGKISVSGATVSNNKANFGGGLYVNLSTSELDCVGSVITGNTATSSGGGVFVQDSAKLYVTGTYPNASVISGNTAINGNGNDVELFDIFGTGLIGMSGFVQIGSGVDGIYDESDGSGNAPQIYVTGPLDYDHGASVIVEGIEQTVAPGSTIIAKAFGTYTDLSATDRAAFTYINNVGEDYRIYIGTSGGGHNDILVLDNFDLQREIYDAVPDGTIAVPDGYLIDNFSIVVEGLNGDPASVTLTQAVAGSANDTIVRGGAFTGDLFQVPQNSRLTLENIIMSGGGNTIANVNGSLVHLQGGELTMRDGAVLKDNLMSGGNGSGVNVGSGSTFHMQGGEISGNTTAGNGSGVYLQDASALLNLSGQIILNGLYNGGASGSNVLVTSPLSGAVRIEGIAGAANGTIVATGSGYTLTESDMNVFSYLPGGLTLTLDPAANRIVLRGPADQNTSAASSAGATTGDSGIPWLPIGIGLLAILAAIVAIVLSNKQNGKK